eukprot:SAG22_NODE_17546_length_303_cov_0.627451_1_plen_77_part_01
MYRRGAGRSGAADAPGGNDAGDGGGGGGGGDREFEHFWTKSAYPVGFTEKAARRALIHCRGDAMQWLCDHSDDVDIN